MPERNCSITAVASFCSVALGWIAHEKWKRRRRGDIIISRRGEALLTPTLPYIFDYLKALQDECDPYTNPKVRAHMIFQPRGIANAPHL